MVSKPIISCRGFRYAMSAQASLVLRVIEAQSALFGSLTITSITSVTGRPRLAQNDRICVPHPMIAKDPQSAPIGGSARVIHEQAKSQKVTLSWAPMRPDRVVHVDAEGRRAGPIRAEGWPPSAG